MKIFEPQSLLSENSKYKYISSDKNNDEVVSQSYVIMQHLILLRSQGNFLPYGANIQFPIKVVKAWFYAFFYHVVVMHVYD